MVICHNALFLSRPMSLATFPGILVVESSFEFPIADKMDGVIGGSGPRQARSNPWRSISSLVSFIIAMSAKNISITNNITYPVDVFHIAVHTITAFNVCSYHLASIEDGAEGSLMASESCGYNPLLMEPPERICTKFDKNDDQ